MPAFTCAQMPIIWLLRPLLLMFQSSKKQFMLRKEACSGAIADLSHVRTERCLADCLTKASANCKNLVDSVMSGDIKEIDSHPAFRSLMEHKAFALAWLTKGLNLLPEICKEICLTLGSL